MPNPPTGVFGGMLTLVSVADGDGDSYSIGTNQDKIYKFYTQKDSDPLFSPGSLTYNLYDVARATTWPLDDYTSEISLIGQDSRVDEVWALLGRLWGYPLEVVQEPVKIKLLDAVQVKDTDAKTITFNFAELFGYDVEAEDLENDPADIALFDVLKDLVTTKNCYILIETFQSVELLASKVVPIEFGVSDDMAKFAVTANSIEAAISNTGMIFDVNGLTIKNGGFKIIEDYTPQGSSTPIRKTIFYYDELSHELHVEGSGTFTGTINATDGTFSGKVDTNDFNANGGTIGGFKIDANGLYSKESESTDNASIRLLSNGIIDADRINLGTGAHINRYLQLGDNAFIWNPEDQDANGKVLEIKNNNTSVVSLTDTGVLNIGQISLRGQTSEIWGNSFSITPELATFTNISASGKISTVVFEKGHIQSVGGLMMFKPAYKIESYSSSVLTLDEEYQGELGSYVYIINKNGGNIGAFQVTAINDNNKKEVTLGDFNYGDTIITLIDIGVMDAQNNKYPLIVGVNSSETSSTFLRPKGITISEFRADGTNPNPKVFLGDLDNSGINFSDTGVTKNRGYGLYSENVYLTGSLTTRVGNDGFAGINTLDGATATQIPGDSSSIVFWAGSSSVQASDIQTAPFQVTKNGSIYASQGIFSGALITNSSISGADIYAARIHGTGDPNQDGYGLAFYDTTDGIVFFEGETGGLSTPTEVFSIGNSGLRKGNDYFIGIDNSGINFRGNDYHTVHNNSNTENPQGYIRMYESFIAGARTSGENVEIIDTKVTFKQQEINFSVSNTQSMSIMQNKVEVKATETQMDNTVLFADKLKYKKVANGYNLFVLS